MKPKALTWQASSPRSLSGASVALRAMLREVGGGHGHAAHAELRRGGERVAPCFQSQSHVASMVSGRPERIER